MENNRDSARSHIDRILIELLRSPEIRYNVDDIADNIVQDPSFNNVVKVIKDLSEKNIINVYKIIKTKLPIDILSSIDKAFKFIFYYNNMNSAILECTEQERKEISTIFNLKNI